MCVTCEGFIFMTAFPGSLDNLYANGVLDYVPYEAYGYTPAAGFGMNAYDFQYGAPINPYRGLKQQVIGQDYIERAKHGKLFNSFSNDVYAGSIYDDSSNGRGSFRESILNEASNAKRIISNRHSIVKGLLAAAVLIGTPLLLFRSRKSPVVELPPISSGSKWNPLNWFKK